MIVTADSIILQATYNRIFETVVVVNRFIEAEIFMIEIFSTIKPCSNHMLSIFFKDHIMLV